MKKIIVLIIATAFCFNLFAQEITPPAEGKSVVYFARVSALGMAINFTFFDSTRLIGKFNGTGYIRHECDPGFHVFWARSENRSFVEANLEAGKIYFIEAVPQMGAIKAGVDLRAINPATDTKRMSRILKLLAKRPAETFTPELLQSDSAKMQDVMIRGWEKYRKDKAEGQTFEQVTATMYYRPAGQ